MYRVALSDIHDAGVMTPNGKDHCMAVEPECDEVGRVAAWAAPNRPPERALIARYTTTTRAAPEATAAAACRSTPWEPPPPYGTRLDHPICGAPMARTSSVSSTGSIV